MNHPKPSIRTAKETTAETAQAPILYGLLKRRRLFLPTLGALAISCGLFLCFLVAIAPIYYRFLAENAPLKGGALLISGEENDRAMSEAIHLLQIKEYDSLYVLCTHLRKGGVLVPNGTDEALNAERIRRLGHGAIADRSVPLPDPLLVGPQATYSSIVNWMGKNGGVPSRITYLGTGAQGRTEQIELQRAFNRCHTQIGVISVSPVEYNENWWWMTSAGFREVLSESLRFAVAICKL